MYGQHGRAWRIGAVYALVGSLWIILSDRVLFMLVPDATTYSHMQTWKGWFYVAFTALLVVSLVKRALDRQEDLLRRTQESEERLQAIFDAVGDALLIHDAATGRILDVNARVRDVFGYEPEDVRGLTPMDLSADLPPWTNAEALTWIHRAARGEQQQFHWLARRRNGSLFWVEVNLRRVDMGGQPVVLALVQDISERRATEDALRVSEERFSKAFHARGVAMAIHDVQGRHLHVNETMCELLGYSEQDLIGRTTAELGLLADRAATRAPGGPHQSGMPVVNEELAIRCGNGERRHVLCSTESIELNGEPCWLELMTDITKLRAAEDARLRGERRLATITENAPAFIAELDLEGCFLYLSRLQPGHSIADVLGVDFTRWASEEERPVMRRAFEAVLASGEPQEYEVRAAGAAGAWSWYATRLAPIMKDGQVGSVILVAQDITAKHLAEEALRASEARFRGLFEQASVGVVLYNARNGRLEKANSALCRIVGYDAGELEGIMLDKLLRAQDLEDDMALVALLRSGARSEFVTEHKLLRKDGLQVWVELSVSPLSGASPDSDLFIVVAHDMTTRRQAELALRESEERYRLLFDSNPHPMWVYDRDSLAFLAVNGAAVAQYGWSRDEFLAMRISDIRPPEDMPALLESVARTSVGLDAAGVWRHIRKSGEEILVEITSHTLDFAMHRAELVLALDVTAREAAVQALTENEARLRLALEAAQQGLFDLNMQTGEAVVSGEYARMLGYPETDTRWSVARLRRHMHPEDQDKIDLALGEYATGKVADHRLEFRLRAQDGRWIWVLSQGRLMERDHEGRPLRLLGTYTDITPLRLAEAGLRESEARFQDIFHSIGDAIIIHDAETGQILQVNETHTKMMRCSFEEALNARPDTHSLGQSPYSAMEAGEWMRRAISEGPQVFAWHVRRQDGSLFWAEVRLQLTSIAGQRRVIAIVRDISEHKEAEIAKAALVESEARYRQLFNSMTTGMSLLELSKDDLGEWVDYRFLEINPAFESMFGVRSQDLDGRIAREAFSTVKPKWLEHFKEVQRTGLPFTFEAHLEEQDRHFVAVAFKHSPGRIATLVQDVTDLRRATQRLERLHEVDAAIINGRPLDEIQDLLLNSLCLAIPCDRVGLILPETDGNGWELRPVGAEGAGPPTALDLPDMWLAQLSRGEILTLSTAHPSLASGAMSQRGEDDPHEVLLLPLQAQDSVLGVLCLFHPSDGSYSEQEKDVAREVADELAIALTQDLFRRQIARHAEDLEHEVARRTAQLEVANQELESFAYSVSHDLRSPLRAINGFVRMLEEDHAEALDQEGLRLLAVVRDNTLHMDQLINNLLALSRVSRGPLEREIVNTKAMVLELFQELSTPEQRGLIRLELGDRLNLMGDPRLLRQVLHNLLSNALKYRLAHTPGFIRVIADDLDGGATLSVLDDGVGFDPAYAHKLFGVFQRLHAQGEFEGTGVGLALVRRIVRRHGGRVWAEGSPNAGAAFHVWLPDQGGARNG